MKTRTIEIFSFDELDERAKDRARDWYRQASADDNFFAETITEEFADDLALFGFTLAVEHVPLLGGKTRAKPRIYWSGFSHQGSGACFEASWRASDVQADKIAAHIADRPDTYTDKDGKQCECEGNKVGNRLAREVLRLAVAYPQASGRATTGRQGYNQLAEEFDTNDDRGMNDDGCAEFKELVYDLARWYYRALETEYEYQNADEQIDEAIRANEYEFLADGTRA